MLMMSISALDPEQT